MSRTSFFAAIAGLTAGLAILSTPSPVLADRRPVSPPEKGEPAKDAGKAAPPKAPACPPCPAASACPPCPTRDGGLPVRKYPPADGLEGETPAPTDESLPPYDANDPDADGGDLPPVNLGDVSAGSITVDTATVEGAKVTGPINMTGSVTVSGGLSAKTFQAGRVETLTVSAGTIAANDLITGPQIVRGDVQVAGDIITRGGSRSPIHALSLQALFATNGPWTAAATLTYEVRWGIIGAALELGAGAWGRFDGEGGMRLVIPAAVFFVIGNDRVGLRAGLRDRFLEPPGTTGSDTRWQQATAAVLEGFVVAPAAGANQLVVGVGVEGYFYVPKGHGWPSFQDPLIGVVLKAGYRRVLNSRPPPPSASTPARPRPRPSATNNPPGPPAGRE